MLCLTTNFERSCNMLVVPVCADNAAACLSTFPLRLWPIAQAPKDKPARCVTRKCGSSIETDRMHTGRRVGHITYPCNRSSTDANLKQACLVHSDRARPLTPQRKALRHHHACEQVMRHSIVLLRLSFPSCSASDIHLRIDSCARMPTRTLFIPCRTDVHLLLMVLIGRRTLNCGVDSPCLRRGVIITIVAGVF
ncbi:hypothetical protein K461DRAFT_176948 [Myriangium duriaei CBS 260.36]|uniref:Uncharacterized protein n=1 Tax=Myriangium duriaei CBS 260.36 TaxID=1168546 RepID=A0A9P4IVM3_9PEZI|nr:hypothetical protein K461DRAFT_176948 [Myriangium duriaei CBS 260.36]